MNDRIHLVLDGELAVESLTPQERQQLASFSSMAEDLAHSLRRVQRPDLAGSVMAAITHQSSAERPHSPSRLLRALRWLWSPRPIAFTWRPLYAAAVVVLMLAGGVFVREWSAGSGLTRESAASEAVLYVQFRLEAPGASRVELAGSFTSWDSAVALVESAPGVWSTLVALEPGVHDYVFLIDGNRWVADPTAPAVDDGFGGYNSRLFLTRPGGNV